LPTFATPGLHKGSILEGVRSRFTPLCSRTVPSVPAESGVLGVAYEAPARLEIWTDGHGCRWDLRRTGGRCNRSLSSPFTPKAALRVRKFGPRVDLRFYVGIGVATHGVWPRAGTDVRSVPIASIAVTAWDEVRSTYEGLTRARVPEVGWGRKFRLLLRCAARVVSVVLSACSGGGTLRPLAWRRWRAKRQKARKWCGVPSCPFTAGRSNKCSAVRTRVKQRAGCAVVDWFAIAWLVWLILYFV
jgi:hypothetical protein